jgi:predicted DCC family thiol-disulfide oxidoreductase YuxK
MAVFLLAIPAMARGPRQPPTPPAKAIPTRPIPRAIPRPQPQNQEHLTQWMERHSNMTLAEQQRALQNEPGFSALPKQVQQRELDQLARLNSMTPQQRGQVLDRTEAIERLTPPQRQQWRGAVQEMNALPIPRRRLMARAIIDLRVMPPEQRERVIASPAFAAQFSDGERQTLRTLLMGEPYVAAGPAAP